MSRARVLGAVLVLAGVTVGGCSSGSSGSSEASLCPSADALRSSIGNLRDVQVVQDGTEAVRQAAAQVGDDVDRLANSAGDKFSGQVSGVQTDVANLSAAIHSLGDAPSTASLSAVGTAVRVLVEDTGVLLDDVRSAC
jgi:hypothetical protein